MRTSKTRSRPTSGRRSGPQSEMASGARSRASRDRDDGKVGEPVSVTIPARTIALFVGIALGSVLLLALAYAARSILLQLVAAIVLAMAAEPLVQIFERRGLKRGAAVGISFAALVVALVAFGYVLLSPLVDQTTRLVHNAPEIADQLSSGNGRLGFLETRFHVVERAKELDAGSLGATSGIARATMESVVRTAGSIVFVLFLTLFVQLGGRQWYESLLGFVSATNRARVRRTGEGISTAVGGYVTGNLLISVVAGSVTAVVLTATSVPYPIALGMIVAIFDLVPMVGATIGTVIVGAVALSTEGVVTAAIVIAAMIVYQQIENNLLQQLVYHRTVKLSPLAIALSVAVGAQLAGVVGALLGIPFAGAVKVVANELIAWRRGTHPPPIV
jgi:predicted PurR-regulated permease PerM